MNYNYYRDYFINIGRYTELDPIGLVGGINLYNYSSQSPLINIDPEGLDWKKGVQIGCALIGLCNFEPPKNNQPPIDPPKQSQPAKPQKPGLEDWKPKGRRLSPKLDMCPAEETKPQQQPKQKPEIQLPRGLKLLPRLFPYPLVIPPGFQENLDRMLGNGPNVA